jgi:hypothetical protein
VVQAVEDLLCKHETLSSNLSSTKTKSKRECILTCILQRVSVVRTVPSEGETPKLSYGQQATVWCSQGHLALGWQHGSWDEECGSERLVIYRRLIK